MRWPAAVAAAGTCASCITISAHEQAESELGAERVDFDRLLAESDFISVHADLNDTTRGMFNAAAFPKMKPTAVFVNTARGPLVVEADLAAALAKGRSSPPGST